MIVLRDNIDKSEIALLPQVLFEGRIIVVQSVLEAERAFEYLKTFPVLGIDTETRPSFAKGKTNQVALMQVSTEDTCFLFRLNYIGVTDSLLQFLQNPNQLKIGLSLHDDFMSLHRKYAFEPKGFIDLQQFVKKYGIEAQSLQKIYALLFAHKISKAQRLTNWEADVLTDKQKAYAATDAWACVRIYNYLRNLVKGEYRVEKSMQPEMK